MDICSEVECVCLNIYLFRVWLETLDQGVDIHGKERVHVTSQN